MEYDNTNRGGVWLNKKRDKDTSPHYKGELNIEGKEYWIAVWKNDPGVDGKKPVLNFRAQVKEPKQDQHNQAKANGFAPDEVEDMDDEIPF